MTNRYRLTHCARHSTAQQACCGRIDRHADKQRQVDDNTSKRWSADSLQAGRNTGCYVSPGAVLQDSKMGAVRLTGIHRPDQPQNLFLSGGQQMPGHLSDASLHEGIQQICSSNKIGSSSSSSSSNMAFALSAGYCQSRCLPSHLAGRMCAKLLFANQVQSSSTFSPEPKHQRPKAVYCVRSIERHHCNESVLCLS